VKKFLFLILISTTSTSGLVYITACVSPDGYPIKGLFFLLMSIAIAGWGTIGVYFLRKKWGPKDSPKFVLRASMKDGLILGFGVVAVLVLGVFGELTWITGLAVCGLGVVCERML
jgi:hypothetical protein